MQISFFAIIVLSTQVLALNSVAENTELENKVAELENKLADIIARIEKVESAPVVEPIVDEFESMNKKLDKTNKYARIFGSK